MGNDRAFGGLRAESQENLVTQSWEVRRTVKKASSVSETRSETDCVTPGLELIAALDTLCDHLIMGLRWSWQEKLDIIWDLILWPLISSRFLILDLLESLNPFIMVNLCMIGLEEEFFHTYWSTMNMKIWMARPSSAPWKMCAMHRQCYAWFG